MSRIGTKLHGLSKGWYRIKSGTEIGSPKGMNGSELRPLMSNLQSVTPAETLLLLQGNLCGGPAGIPAHHFGFKSCPMSGRKRGRANLLPKWFSEACATRDNRPSTTKRWYACSHVGNGSPVCTQCA